MHNNSGHINDIFLWCNDIDEIRDFYSNLLELAEESYQPDPSTYGHKWVSYMLDNGQRFVYNARSQSLNVEEKWAFQPSSAIENGIERISWTLEFSREKFEKISERVLESKYQCYQEKVEQRQGYVALTVMDPMGNTLDLYYLENTE